MPPSLPRLLGRHCDLETWRSKQTLPGSGRTLCCAQSANRSARPGIPGRGVRGPPLGPGGDSPPSKSARAESPRISSASPRGLGSGPPAAPNPRHLYTLLYYTITTLLNSNQINHSHLTAAPRARGSPGGLASLCRALGVCPAGGGAMDAAAPQPTVIGAGSDEDRPQSQGGTLCGDVCRFGRGDDAVGNPHRTQISQFELFECVMLFEIRQTLLCRAIRDNSISVNSIFPPSYSCTRAPQRCRRRDSVPRMGGRSRGGCDQGVVLNTDFDNCH